MQQGQLTPIRERVKTVRDLLDRSKEQIALALPKHLTAERMARVAMTAVQRSPKLLECSPQSLIGAIIEASQLGLEPDGVLGYGYLIPYKVKGRLVCQFQAGYKGLLDLARRSGEISTIYADVVRDKDQFDFEKGLHPTLTHKPSRDEQPGEILAVYAVAHLKDGGAQFEVMWRREVDAIRRRSRAADNGPWVTDYAEMAKKTVLRRLCKMLPLSVEAHRAVAIEELTDAGLPPDMAVNVDPDNLPKAPNALEELIDSDEADDPPAETKEDDNGPRLS